MKARILLVHGAFNEFMGPHELKARWLPALRDGLWHHDVEIDDAEVGVCFYGDLFRREPGTEREQQLQKSRAGVAESLANLVGSNLIAALGHAASEAAFDRIVDMVTIMATKPDLRSRMRARAEAMVDDDTRVIVSHSLGTLFSYMALCHHPQWRVHTFVTLGSPLASPMIFEHLDPPAVEGKGQWPGSVKRWVNVRAIGDKAAAVTLREKFGPRVEEILIDNGHRAHDPEPYLNAAATGAAIAAALSVNIPKDA
jgi:pimeloyl-ACP methyl ester carboxylesterase